jgi:hypothetical protein
MLFFNTWTGYSAGTFLFGPNFLIYNILTIFALFFYIIFDQDVSSDQTEGHYDDHKFSLGKLYRYYNEQWHVHRRGRYLKWLFLTFFAAAVVFYVPWFSLNGFINPFSSSGAVMGGIMNVRGHTGDFIQSSIASLFVMLNVYHSILFIFTRHWNALVFSSYVMSVIVTIVVLVLDNIECFR